MTKTQAIWVFGISRKHAAGCIGISLRTLRSWPDGLTKPQADRVRGAAMRLGYRVPPELMHTYHDEAGNLHRDEPVEGVPR